MLPYLKKVYVSTSKNKLAYWYNKSFMNTSHYKVSIAKDLLLPFRIGINC